MAVALANLLWVATHPLPELPPELLSVDLVLRSWLIPPAIALAQAFLLASALDARRTWLALGQGLLFALTVAEAALLWLELGPGTSFEMLSLIFGLVAVVGWAFIIGGALRGEIPKLRSVRIGQPAVQPSES